jgi:hypothetical protein
MLKEKLKDYAKVFGYKDVRGQRQTDPDAEGAEEE